MNANRTTARTCRAAAVGATLLVLATACAKAPAPAPPDPAPAGPAAGTTTPGRVSVKESGADLLITDAIARLNASGSGELTMTVHNGSGVPEHLAMIGTPDSGRAILQGGRGTNGSPTSAGILIQPDSTVLFGSEDAPRALLTKVHGITAHHTVPLILQFGVAGLVNLQARVTTS
jgi:copper(I)-binding protein